MTAKTLRSRLAEAIQDVTDDPEYQSTPRGDQSIGDGADVVPPDGSEQVGQTRYVKGAHLVRKRQTDVDGFEELWVYEIDPTKPDAMAKIETAILASTDIDPNTLASEDGNQRASTWVAGNAKMMHLTGLVN